MMNIEKQIIKRMEDYGYTRLDAIASMNLGERSEAAKRASANRARRRKLMEYGMDFATACLVVNKENERWLQMMKRHFKQKCDVFCK
jgi:ectoine hydroxylase-related dioxygenase (phytanoyl-CoA dioxygenase family)